MPAIIKQQPGTLPGPPKICRVGPQHDTQAEQCRQNSSTLLPIRCLPATLGTPVPSLGTCHFRVETPVQIGFVLPRPLACSIRHNSFPTQYLPFPTLRRELALFDKPPRHRGQSGYLCRPAPIPVHLPGDPVFVWRDCSLRRRPSSPASQRLLRPMGANWLCLYNRPHSALPALALCRPYRNWLCLAQDRKKNSTSRRDAGVRQSTVVFCSTPLRLRRVDSVPDGDTVPVTTKPAAAVVSYS